MPWLEFWLLTVVIMGSHGCLKCSKEAMTLRTHFRNSYLEEKLQQKPQLKTKLQQLLDNVIEQLSNQPIDQHKYMGIIDELTLKKLTVYFKRMLNQIKENNFEDRAKAAIERNEAVLGSGLEQDQQLFNEMMWSLQKLVSYFQELMPQFTKVYCSNDCGRMVYIFISCFSCETNQQSCTKNYHCGERNIRVETDGDLVLDCALKWHKASHGTKTYKFYRIVNAKEELMASGTDSFLIKKEANMKDAGRYRCKMMDTEGYPASQLEFQVVVQPRSKTTSFTRPPPVVPPSSILLSPPPLLPVIVENPLTLGISSRAPPPEADWIAWKVSGITGGVLFFIVAVFLCYYRHMAKKEEEEDDDEDDDEEDEDESDSDSSELMEM